MSGLAPFPWIWFGTPAISTSYRILLPSSISLKIIINSDCFQTIFLVHQIIQILNQNLFLMLQRSSPYSQSFNLLSHLLIVPLHLLFIFAFLQKLLSQKGDQLNSSMNCRKGMVGSKPKLHIGLVDTVFKSSNIVVNPIQSLLQQLVLVLQIMNFPVFPWWIYILCLVHILIMGFV